MKTIKIKEKCIGCIYWNKRCLLGRVKSKCKLWKKSALNDSINYPAEAK